jgi:hypothetical protein
MYHTITNASNHTYPQKQVLKVSKKNPNYILGLCLFAQMENKGCVTHCGLAIYTKKYLKPQKKKKIMETHVFHHAKL